MKMNVLIGLLLINCLLLSCASNEIGNSKDVNQDKIYQDLKIEYTQGEKLASIRSQFRFAGEKGTTLVLSKPSAISFDGEVITVDSSGFAGAFYNTNVQAVKLLGKHSFVLTDVEGNKKTNECIVQALELLNLPTTISTQQDVILPIVPLKNLHGYIAVQTVKSDSMFMFTQELEPVTDKIIIPTANLKKQKGTAVTVQCTLHYETDLQQKTSEGGKISIEYTLQPVTISIKN
jgi:hypothetical protein